jgi:predicted metal-dependent HD superfamily phosphohydrolase
MNFEGAKQFILEKLKNELKPTLYYHDVSHTIDVYQSTVRIAELEKVSSADYILLKTAAMYHDCGMLTTYTGHEEASCVIAAEYLPDFGYTVEEIERVNKMIMATKLPQNASNQLEQIICDADLDYLGREDFFMISHRLKLEWNLQEFNVTTLKEWYELQVSFLESHQFFTRSAKETRDAGKLKNLNQIKEICMYHHG